MFQILRSSLTGRTIVQASTCVGRLRAQATPRGLTATRSLPVSRGLSSFFSTSFSTTTTTSDATSTTPSHLPTTTSLSRRRPFQLITSNFFSTTSSHGNDDDDAVEDDDWDEDDFSDDEEEDGTGLVRRSVGNDELSYRVNDPNDALFISPGGEYLMPRVDPHAARRVTLFSPPASFPHFFFLFILPPPPLSFFFLFSFFFFFFFPPYQSTWMSNDEEDVHFVVKPNTKVQSLVTNF